MAYHDIRCWCLLIFDDIWWYQSLQSISRPKDEYGRWGFMGRPLGRWVDWGWRDTAGTPSNCSDFSFLQAFGREFADGATVLVARADEVLRQQYEVFDFNLARVCQIWYGKTETHARTHTHNQRISEKILVIGWTILVNLRDPEIVAAVSFDRFKAAMFGNHWAWTSPVVPCHFLLPFVRT